MQKAVDRPVAARSLEGSRRLKAIGLICSAAILFTVLDATAKYLTLRAGLPLLEIVWLRFATQLLLMIAFLGLVNVPGLFRTGKLGHQLLRSCFLLGSTVFNFGALLYLRLDQTATILYLMPLLVALLAGPLLGEWVGWRRMIAIGVGFLGILVVLRPGFSSFHWAFAISLAGTVSYSLYNLSTRYLAPHDQADVTLFYGLLVPVIAMAPVAYHLWIWPAQLWHWAPIFLTGACGGLGHYLLIRAHGLAPASTLAPFSYISLLSVITLGYVLFGDLPDVFTLTGSAILIGSGLYLIHRERVVSAARPAVPDQRLSEPPRLEPPRLTLTGPFS